MQATATLPMLKNIKSLDRKRFAGLYQYGIYIVFFILLIFFSTTNPNFLTVNNALLILQQSAPLGIAAIGMIFVLIVGGIDISIGQNMFLTAMVVGKLMETMNAAGFLGAPFSYVLIGLTVILVSGAMGAINGFLIAKLKIIPFITTLATMGIARGLGLTISNSQGFYVEALAPISNGRILGIPNVVLALLLLVILFDYILRRTPYGRQLMAIGGDTAAAEKIGINVTRNVFMAYVICGVMTGIGGLLAAGQIDSVAINFADGHEFLVISAAVLGGASLFGGKGNVFPGAIIGILLVTTTVNGMT